MKLSIQVFTSLVVSLAMSSQPAIATYIHADRQFDIEQGAVDTGTINRKKLLECSQKNPCKDDLLVVATKLDTKLSTVADLIFKDIIPKIRRELPHDMVMRLPSSVPYVYKEGSNPQGTRVYATNSRYSSDIESGSYLIFLSRTPDCETTSCGVGYISASRNKPSIRDSDSGIESKDKEESIQIKPGLSGYYFYARAGSAGHRHNIYWQQNRVYFHLNFRGFEKKEVRQMAASMATGNLIRPNRLAAEK